MTWRELLAEATEVLRRAGIAEYEADAWILFSEVFDMSRAKYFLCRDQEISLESANENDTAGNEAEGEMSAGSAEQFRQMIRRRCERIPLQQITGHQEFMGLDFQVNEHVLVPRQDTEVLVETVLSELKEIASAVNAEASERVLKGWTSEAALSAKRNEDKCLRIVDMCAGSGCIGISLERLAEIPVDVLAADISDEAILVAKRNAERLGCEHYLILKSDLFEQIEGTFDVIVSNPPYIPSAVIETLDDEVKLHEPRLALDGEADGLAFYRKISLEASRRLNKGGRIYYEIGYDQGTVVSDILAANGFVDIRVIKDLAGLHRVVAAKCPR